MARELGTRVLATVLFTDIVGSTAIAEELSDSRWRELLRRHHAIVRRELRRFRGREIDTAGDGFLALFDSPAQGVRCACAVSEAVRELGIEIRAGLHLGEVELTDGKAQGIAVHIGARILALAKPGDVLVSAPLRTTVAGSGMQFEARGRRRLKGVEGTWPLFAVAAVDGDPRAPALDTEEAARRRAAISPGAAGRRPSLMALGLLAVVLIVAAVLGTRRSAPPPPAASGPPIGSLVLIDPATNRTAQAIRGAMPLASIPGFGTPRLAAGEGSVWVLHGLTVTAVDPRRGGVWERLQLGRGLDNKDVEVGHRTVWVLVQERLDRINPATGDVLGGTTIRPELGTFTGEIAIGREGVWLGSGNTLLRLDPGTGRVNDMIPVPGTVDDLATGEGSIWVADSLAATVFRIEPRSGRVVSTVDVQGRIDQIAVGEDYVWILDSSLGTLSSIRPDTEEVREPFRVGDDPAALTVGFGSVWVAGGDQETVLRINPSTLAQEEIPVGGPVSGITVDEDERAVWVTIS